MLFTTRFWGSTAMLLYILLFQGCQSNSLSATAEEELAASISASSTHQYASSESLVVRSKEDFSIFTSTRCLDLSESLPLASGCNFPEDAKPSAKRRHIKRALKHSNKKIRGEEEQRCIRRATLDIFLSIAGVEPDKAAGFLEVVLVAAQDKEFRQQALEVLDNVSKASPDMFSECLPSLRAAAQEGDKAVRLLALKTLGEVEWRYYFGEVGPAPDLPKNIIQILDAPCSFWPERQVKDTHLLVLIPVQVNRKPFTLNLLEELIKTPRVRGSETHFRYYDSDIEVQLGDNTPASSYWVLLAHDILPKSRDKTYAAQKELVLAHTSRTGLSYEIPKVLEVVTAILAHHVRNRERLYNDDPWPYTRCQELVSCGSSNYPAVVGGFESSGLCVRDNRYDYYNRVGIAGCRKFF